MTIYLFCYSDVYNDFRIKEFYSIIETYLLDITLEEGDKFDIAHRPYLLVSSGDPNHITIFASRSVLLKFVLIDVVVSTEFAKILNLINIIYSEFDSSKKIKIYVHSYMKSLSQEIKLHYIKKILDSTFLKNKISLDNYEISFGLLFDYTTSLSNNSLFKYLVYFGRMFCEGSSNLARIYSITQRPFIGNTTMDPMLSFLMINQAHIRPNDIICDPFCGTGGILLAAAHFGAYVFGMDVNYRLIHGLNKSSRSGYIQRDYDENIFKNFYHYKLNDKCIGFVVGDCGQIKINQSIKFDAIVTDPPYGIRESSKKKLSKSIVVQDLDHAITTLFNFALNTLKEGGYLVYWQPIILTRDDNSSSICSTKQTYETIEHNHFELVSKSLQQLSSKTGRLLVTMKRVPLSKINQSIDKINNQVKQLNKSFRNLYFEKK